MQLIQFLIRINSKYFKSFFWICWYDINILKNIKFSNLFHAFLKIIKKIKMIN